MITIGHRGAAGYEPENTLLSFQKAIDLKVDMIEFDVRICKSGEVVIFHDDNLEYKTNGSGPVEETPFNELRKLNAGKGQRIPTLPETIEIIGNRTKINIELKGKSTAEATIQIVRQFIDGGKIKAEDLLISSFRMDELFIISKHFPSVKIAPLFRKLPKNFALTASKLKAFSINLSFRFLTKNDVDRVHASGCKLYVYTVNKAEDKAKMKDWGVDGIFTDFP